MSQPPAFTLRVSEDAESDGREPSPDNEGALHSSFRQLIEEQSSLVAAGAETELQEMGGERPSRPAPPDTWADSWPEPGHGEQHPGYATALRILASMPSRTIGRSRGAVLSQYYNRTARLRRRSARPSLQQLGHTARPSLRHYDLESDPAHASLEDKRSLLARELLSLSPAQRSHMLLAVPLSLAEKRSLRRELSQRRSRPELHAHSADPASPCAWCKDCIALGCRQLWYRLLALLLAAQPWHYALKQISGRFGSSVLSYFLFLKTLLMFNILSFLLLLVFVVALQAVYPPAAANPRPFTGLELLTGAGHFTHSLLYYGYYSNVTLNDPSSLSGSAGPPAPPPLPYNMPLAYVFTVGASFFLTCFLLVFSMSRSFGRSYRGGGSAGDLALKVFCAWDFKVVQRRSVKLQCENICTQLKELLAERQSRSCPLSLCQRLRHVAVLLLGWVLALSSVLGCVVAVHYFSEHMHAVPRQQAAPLGSAWQQQAVLLALPLAVSLLNMLMPRLYTLLAAWEKQDSPVAEVYVAICRNLLLKMVVLGLLCYQWLSRRVVCSTKECWETCVGQDLYRFVVMDFIFTLLDTVFGELVWRLILEKRRRSTQRPEFDIARNVLELIYGQTLTWLGILFAPLLPAVQVLKLLLLFYIKKTSLMQNCQAPSKPWQASHMSTVFITLLCFPSFLGAAIFASYTIWSVKPSESCGPFRGLQTINEAVKVWIELLEESNPNITWFTWMHQYLVENTFFLFFLSGMLLAMTYLNIQVVRGQRRIIRRLEEQIANEGEDKRFLIRKLHTVYEQKAQCA